MTLVALHRHPKLLLPQPAEPPTTRGDRHLTVVSTPSCPSLQSTGLVLSCKAAVHILLMVLTVAKGTFPNSSDRPQRMTHADQTPAKVPEASRLLSSANNWA